MADYKQEYAEQAKRQRVLRKNCPEVMADFQKIPASVLKEKHLSTKAKELMSVAIAISVRCEDCILGHVRSAIKAGATIEELSETVEVAILMGGGPSTAYGAKALSIAEYLFENEE